MKINLAEQSGLRTWLSVFIYDVMTNHTKGANWEEVFQLTGKDKNEVEVSVRVNGVEVSFESFIKNLDSQYDYMLGKKAKELLKESFGNLIDTLTGMQDEAKLKLEHDVLPSWRKNDGTELTGRSAEETTNDP